MSKTKLSAFLISIVVVVAFFGFKYSQSIPRSEAPQTTPELAPRLDRAKEAHLEELVTAPTTRKAQDKLRVDDPEIGAELRQPQTRVEVWLREEFSKDLKDMSLTDLIWSPNWVNELSEEQYFAYQTQLIEYRAMEPKFFREKFRLEGLQDCLERLHRHTPESSMEEKARLGFALHSTLDSVLYLTLLSSGGRVHEITDDPSAFDDYYDRGTYMWKTRMLFELQQVVIFYDEDEAPFVRKANDYIKSRTQVPLADKPQMPHRFEMFIGLPPLPGEIQADLIAAYTHALSLQEQRVPSNNPYQTIK